MKKIFIFLAAACCGFSTVKASPKTEETRTESSYKVATSQGNIAIWDSQPDAPSDHPTIVFLHGHLTNKRFFSEQMRSPLLNSYRLIALDLPGYGESDAPFDPEQVYSFPGYADAVAETIENLHLENVIVAGWSLGGHVGLELTSRLPYLKGLLITGTPPIEISADGFSKGFRVVDPKILQCFGKGNLTKEEVELMATGSGYDGSKEKQFIVDAILQTDEGAKVIYPQSIVKGVGQNEVDIVRKWPKPIAVIAGKDEILVNNDYIINEVPFHNLWKNKVFLIEEAGHPVHMQKPQEFNQLVKEFADDVLTN